MLGDSQDLEPEVGVKRIARLPRRLIVGLLAPFGDFVGGRFAPFG